MIPLINTAPVTLFTLGLIFWLISEAYVVFKKRTKDAEIQNKTSDMMLNFGTIFLFSMAFYLIYKDHQPFALGYVANGIWRFIGIVIVVIGIIFRQYSIYVLGTFFNGYIRIRDDHQLVKNGPYKIFRHPSYFGSFLCYLGLGLTVSNVIAFVLFPVCITFMYVYRLKVEEKVLIDAFGQEYQTYKKETWGFLPFVK